MYAREVLTHSLGLHVGLAALDPYLYAVDAGPFPWPSQLAALERESVLFPLRDASMVDHASSSHMGRSRLFVIPTNSRKKMLYMELRTKKNNDPQCLESSTTL